MGKPTQVNSMGHHRLGAGTCEIPMGLPMPFPTHTGHSHAPTPFPFTISIPHVSCISPTHIFHLKYNSSCMLLCSNSDPVLIHYVIFPHIITLTSSLFLCPVLVYTGKIGQFSTLEYTWEIT